MVNVMQHNILLFSIILGIFGLSIGSFLNVVIYRFPKMLEQQWREECMEFLKQPNKHVETINLCKPRSHCPQCKKQIPFWYNIPLLSYLMLRGKCANCQRKISMRYPLVELLSGLLTIYIAYHFGFSWQTLGALIFTWFLIALVFIDWDTQLLPDEITLPLLWLGLLWNIYHPFTPLAHAVTGAVAGYASLWTIAWLFKKIRKMEGMGYGDFKLTAALGAWVGWQLLPLIVILASLLGAVIGITILVIKKQESTTPLPFGPYLASAGWIALLWGENIMQHYYWLLLH